MALRKTKNIYRLDPNMIVRPREGRSAWKWYTKHVRSHAYLRWPFLALGGNWDKIVTIPEIAREDEMIELFVKGIPPTKTETYLHMVEELNRTGLVRFPRIKTLEQIDRYFERLHRLYDDIKINGYKTYKELGTSSENEIQIRITRKGELVKAGEGTHRLAIAKVLGLKEVPVVIDLVHASLWRKWKKERPNRSIDPLDYGIQTLKARVEVTPTTEIHP